VLKIYVCQDKKSLQSDDYFGHLCIAHMQLLQ